MRCLFIATGIIALLALSAGKAFACSCGYPPPAPCQAYGQASAVFVGTVIEIRTVILKRDNYESRERAVRLSIDSPFRGVERAEVEIHTGMSDADCGFGFVQLQQYLVYAYEHEGKLSTSICTRTRPIARATVDLSYVQGLATAKPGASISGEAVRYRTNEKGLDNRPLEGITITIEGQTNTEIKTDTKGKYRVEGLPAGEYLVKVGLPEGFDTRGAAEQRVKVADRGCSSGFLARAGGKTQWPRSQP